MLIKLERAMKKTLIIIFLFSFIFSNDSNPCEDAKYLNLKEKELDNMSEREYEYFLNKDKQCNQYISVDSNASTNIRFNEISDLKSRRRMDLLGLLIVWGATIGVDAAVSYDMTTELLFPAIGPFLVEDPIEDYKVALYLSGIIQTAFLVDYFRTSNEINNIKKNYSYHLNINPIHPKLTLSYNIR